MSHTLQTPLELPLHGSALIEASAGTGKTYTIAAQYVRFILAHIQQNDSTQLRAEPLLPPQILVVTFTKAATAELKERIRQRLVDTAYWFRQPVDEKSGDDVIEGLRACYAVEQWPACAYALQTAGEWMDEASVKTIHSWCQGVLKEHAFSSGSLFEQTLTTDLEHIRLDAVRDYWRSFIYPLSAELLPAVHRVAPTPQVLKERIAKLWSRPVTEEFTAPDIRHWIEQAHTDFQARILEQHRAWSYYLARWYALIEDGEKAGLFNKPRTINLKKSRKDFAGIEQWIALPQAAALQDLPTLSKTVVENYGPAKFPQLYDGAAIESDLLTAIVDLDSALNASADISQPLLDHALSWIKARVTEQLHQQALMGFDDIIAQTRQALSGQHGQTLGDLLRNQYPVAMIDEFQDTDPDQYAIFNAVYDIARTPDDCAVFLIGDPKQAIYAFRGADIFTYLQAREDTRGRHYSLATNFRSTTQMVEAVNGIFLAAESHRQGQAFMFEHSVPFLPSQARGRAERLIINNQAHEDALTVWLGDGSEQDEQNTKKPFSKEMYRQTYAQRCASYITGLLNSAGAGHSGIKGEDGSFTPLQSKHIAILVSTHEEGYMMQRALRERSVASVYLSDRNSVYDSVVAGDIYRILLACAAPDERGAIQSALYTALLDLPVEALERLQHDDLLWDKQVEQFHEFSRIWRTQGILSMMFRMVHVFDIAGRLLSKAGGERLLTDFLHLAELLQSAATALDGEQALLRYLHEQIYQREQSGQPADEQIVRLESDAELIQIVTVHKSKGLEYPLVFVPFASLCRPVKSSDEVFYYHDENGNKCQTVTPTTEALEAADKERLAEDIRKLYVALTRSRYACWVGVAQVGDWEQSALAHLAAEHSDPALKSESDFLSRIKATWADHPYIDVCTLPDEQNEVLYRQEDVEPEPEFCRMPAGHRFTSWWIASYSALKYGALREPQSAWEDTLIEDTQAATLTENQIVEQVADTTRSSVHLHDLPRGAGPGTFLHNLLEEAADLGFSVVAEQGDVRRALVEKKCRHGHWKERRDLLEQWLQAYLRQSFALPVSDGNGEFSLSDLQRYKAEPEFWLRIDGLSAERIDNLVSAAVMPQFPRPGLQPNYLNGMLKGFIDLVFEYKGRYFIIDYKSNYLGASDAAYTSDAMRDAILASRYDLQYVLYTLALHKLLKNRLGDQYAYETHIGGVIYLFLRGYTAPGAGAFTDRPPQALIEQLDALSMSTDQERF